MPFTFRFPLVLAAVIALVTAACPVDYSTCTLKPEDSLNQTQGRANLNDAGTNTIVTLEWPGTSLPAEYFALGELKDGDEAALQAFQRMTPDAGAVEVEFSPIDRGFSFTLGFIEPARTAFVGTCPSGHGGMADTLLVEVEVGAPTPSGSRSVSSTTKVSLGAY